MNMMRFLRLVLGILSLLFAFLLFVVSAESQGLLTLLVFFLLLGLFHYLLWGKSLTQQAEGSSSLEPLELFEDAEPDYRSRAPSR